MSDNMKKCSKCKKEKTIENFDGGKALCIKCLEKKKKYRENHREELRQKAKEIYENNKKHILAICKEYREQKRDTIIEKKKQYREDHKEEIKDKKKQYYEQNKEQIQEKKKQYKTLKIECPVCKCLVGKYTIKRHEESQKHQLKLKGQEQTKQHQQIIDYLNANFPSYQEY